MIKFRELSFPIFSVIALAFSTLASAAEKPADKAQALLQDVKTREIERQKAAKGKEVERLNEDLAKQRKESDDLQNSIESMTTATGEAGERLAQLSSKKQRLLQTLELVSLQITAEKLKLDGLKMLGEAQNKSLAALSKRIEQTEVRGAIEAGELKLIAEPAGPEAKDSGAERRAEISELKKKLTQTEHTVSTARIAAREAMQAATAKLESAQAADEKAKDKSAELGFDTAAASPEKEQAMEVPRAVRAR